MGAEWSPDSPLVTRWSHLTGATSPFLGTRQMGLGPEGKGGVLSTPVSPGPNRGPQHMIGAQQTSVA